MAQANIFTTIPEFKPENNTITEWLRLVEGPIKACFDTEQRQIQCTILKLGKYASRISSLIDNGATWEDFKQLCIETCQPSLGSSSALTKLEALTLKPDFDDSLQDVARLTSEAFPLATKQELQNHIWRQMSSMTPGNVKQLFKMHESNDYKTNITNLRKLVASQPKSELNMMNYNRGRPTQQQSKFLFRARTPPSPPRRPRAPLVNPFRYNPCSPKCQIINMRKDASAQMPIPPFASQQQQRRRLVQTRPQPRPNLRALEDTPTDQNLNQNDAVEEEMTEEEYCYSLEEEEHYEEDVPEVQDF